ncbi:(2Fe-2S)-binding protein [Ketogulonicigenium vulgare]|uniref:Aerobic-type carbon monoxide dehydrogenase small subunit CoxS/CutS-like protein n=1 Tax=Ketogulonicigenium vulgare (strain WSH-001) TaxID=759362 RepID=F9YBB5_KETVW|nr:(2Fe-2S)-binding protein [Ketogulonicigenium vulgare]ADO44144.1 (2Fe-2S)-binding protein [Ketogulonicigenium vulgare Y25]AEM42667.1 Aerobic-type carbon monoxide dehydrogenase small subunit CoxS/CutS-like protein [Ketogulonicigenium vulgare WSH-001]ALJ82472.1 isoquinoline 1-oxidoreductase [Ketogulonicigenium vulgare]ANW35256.1 isoquinoline 1-oxidoreductase [Ketogulonicigenium vulgare]AOZ53368.1 (2Fe-2S)-binding protein [Ketogulonicigenium vulgare]
MAYTLNINGESRTVDAAEGTPLLWVLRDDLKLTGTKFGCGIAACGACTVMMNGEPVRSCQQKVETLEGAEITTIEGVSGNIASAVQQAWAELNVVQCGYCQSGQIVQAIGLLTENPKPNADDIDTYMSGNVCRCATYQRIRGAVLRASEIMEA